MPLSGVAWPDSEYHQSGHPSSSLILVSVHISVSSSKQEKALCSGLTKNSHVTLHARKADVWLGAGNGRNRAPPPAKLFRLGVRGEARKSIFRSRVWFYNSAAAAEEPQLND